MPLVALLAACSTTDVYQKRAEAERERQEKYVEHSIKQAPDWMTSVPTSSDAVFESGSAVSSDFSMADVKAKADAYGKICMMAGGRATQRTQIYRTDSEVTSTELSEMALRTSCSAVDLTGVEVRDIKRVAEGTRFRVYVLVALPTGDANLLRKAKDARRQHQIAAQRAPEVFKELDEQEETHQDD
jgi:hypothetical protein